MIIVRLSSRCSDRTHEPDNKVAAECLHNPDYLIEIAANLLIKAVLNESDQLTIT